MLKKCLILMVIIYLLELYNSSEIVIPFFSRLSEIPKNQTPLDFVRALSSNELYSKIKIGTPPQQFEFLVDFENYNTYVIKDDNTAKKYPRFFDNISSTFTYLGKKVYYSDSDFSFAINSSDIVTIGNTLNNYNYTFLHAVDFRNNKKFKYPGVIGFNSVQNDNPTHRESGLVYQLKSKNMINNYMFTLSFNENDFNGNIIIGKNIYEDYTSENFTSDYCLVTTEYQYYWGWNYMTTSLNSYSLGITQISIRPELGSIILNLKHKDFFKKFFDEKIKEGKCNEIANFYYCDKNINIDIGELTFEIKRKGLKFSLNSKDLFMEYNNKLYFLIEFGFQVDKSIAILGYPFLKKYDLIFEQDKRQMGFYNFKIKYEYKGEKGNKKNNKNDEENSQQEIKTDNINHDNISEDKNKHNEKNPIENENYDTKKIIFILLIIFLTILVIYFIFTLFRKCERKRKGKIFEELFL